MGDPTVTLRPADGLAYVETLLERNDLPTADVRTAPAQFYVGLVDGDPVGVGGVERYGPDALLRSVVVEERVRGGGVGAALCDALEATARDAGVETLYLLTTTAAEFFAARGYVRTDRDDVPDTVRGSPEFEALCPASAVPMRKPL
ncbi:arsenic resistance N-acetyltransferase ArsN2 [Halomarina litorea]|uniref:arsenic resistance N-acetyltransferase ArsN2 n=1 Tax=Halomarina litorea TaxID=2961595 RepID=UPI0020C3ACB1|nr:arsenic resistance N-acetyltransferase ArsN2 [Halomarina sp. BCD28]